MVKRKKVQGRPMKKGYPPRIDATPEELVQTMFRASLDMAVDTDKVYRCEGCAREVNYPETLYRDGRCEACHTAAVAQQD